MSAAARNRISVVIVSSVLSSIELDLWHFHKFINPQIMAFPGLLLIIFLFLLSIFSHASVLDLGNITQSLTSTQTVTNLTNVAYANCTTNNSWLAPRFGDIEDYAFTCHDALFKARMDPAFNPFDLDTEYEFLNRGAIARTLKPKIHLPRKYVECKSLVDSTLRCSLMMMWKADQGRDLPSCTIAIAMVASLRTGGPALPGQPVQHYGLSDVMTPRELLYSPGFLNCPFVGCLRRVDSLGRALGWTLAGNGHPFADSRPFQ